MLYRYTPNQKELEQHCELSEKRKKLHPEAVEKFTKILHEQPLFNSEREALEHALNELKEEGYIFGIMAETKKINGKWQLAGLWCVPPDGKGAQAAEYLGWEMIYDRDKLDFISSNKIPIKDIIP